MPRRMLDTALWSDDRFGYLEAPAQLVYLRLVTGEDTNAAGASRAPVKRLAVDTNLERGQVDDALEELVRVGLVQRFPGGWLWLPTFIRYQLSGPGFIRAIRRCAAESPADLAAAITEALEVIVGPGDESIAANRAARRTPKADKAPASKGGNSRGKATEPKPNPLRLVGPGSDPPSHPLSDLPSDPPSDRGLFEREGQDQDQDQDRPPVCLSWSAHTNAGARPAPGGPRAPATGGDLVSIADLTKLYGGPECMTRPTTTDPA